MCYDDHTAGLCDRQDIKHVGVCGSSANFPRKFFKENKMSSSADNDNINLNFRFRNAENKNINFVIEISKDKSSL
ncbi:hypothetical protein GLOIN_2v1639675 [Rhizophagus irregularis DAOM 181602=DAOM 197198]|nr:hypothetical protein GLOIN_2v1639675 [Rhizophagus irregularis DAOM 181602=DAOM 197198]